MSASIYYTAFRGEPLNSAESAAVEALIKKFAVEKQLEKYFQTGTGLNWESFHVRDRRKPTQPGVVLEGGTKLPDNSVDAIWVGLQHWCQLLCEIRNAVPGANWRVHVDDHEIVWDEKRNAYDPSQSQLR